MINILYIQLYANFNPFIVEENLEKRTAGITRAARTSSVKGINVDTSTSTSTIDLNSLQQNVEAIFNAQINETITNTNESTENNTNTQ